MRGLDREKAVAAELNEVIKGENKKEKTEKNKIEKAQKT